MIILLDAGHGIDTPGKRSPDNTLLEYKYCREIMNEVYSILTKMGYIVYKIPEDDTDMPLYKRYTKVNEYCKIDDSILISIHCNAAGNGSKWMNGTGFEVWTSKGQTKSDILAECFYTEAQSILKGIKIRKDNSDGDSDKESNFAILYKTKCPAVLTENLFMDNKQDVEYLLSEQGRQNIINLHVNSIVRYLNKIK